MDDTAGNPGMDIDDGFVYATPYPNSLDEVEDRNRTMGELGRFDPKTELTRIFALFAFNASPILCSNGMPLPIPI